MNDRIRRLMEGPADERRSAEYVRLLGLWADAPALPPAPALSPAPEPSGSQAACAGAGV
ncbi:hypothetical protein V1J52_17425 [Streptomyces sp. TRM 70351]|uniref:hypothetical protein n=1 Tax=Streptomyces sp. TRM 70351 TaxID=3116552 RepID=UPI002E7ABB88|nr:hypothetical protein [Streptomyces sp. TRM 70351]MEE1929942.1 hypothetical protein [Streptomyces sp. TRM 70351]